MVAQAASKLGSSRRAIREYSDPASTATRADVVVAWALVGGVAMTLLVLLWCQ